MSRVSAPEVAAGVEPLPPGRTAEPVRAAPDRIWSYGMEHDGFSLDDKRQPVAENDLPDVLRR